MKYKLAFLAIMFSGLTAYLFVHNGYYPVAIVDSRMILARDFEREFNSALIYYQNALATYSDQKIDLTRVADFVLELRRATLDNLIEDVLISNELKGRLGDSLEKVLVEKLPSFNESAAALYGLTPSEFKERVLVPQAHREFLESYLVKEKSNLQDWLADSKGFASVYIFVGRFHWDAGVALK